jgi:hypothetical protein
MTQAGNLGLDRFCLVLSFSTLLPTLPRGGQPQLQPGSLSAAMTELPLPSVPALELLLQGDLPFKERPDHWQIDIGSAL